MFTRRFCSVANCLAQRRVENYATRQIFFIHLSNSHVSCAADAYPVNVIHCHVYKQFPLQAWSGAHGSRKLRFPDFMTTAQGCGKVVSFTHRQHLPPGNSSATRFCWRLRQSQGYSAIGRIMPMKNSRDTIWNTVTCTNRKFRFAIHSLHRSMSDFKSLGRPFQQHCHLLVSYCLLLSFLPL
jgi:hypothetical protein